jgi:hypothetical protein
LLNIANKIKIVPNLSISFVQAYVEDRKKLEAKNDFLNFICREFFVWLSVKKSMATVSFCAESFLFGSRQRSLFAKCFFCAESQIKNSRQRILCREFFISLSAQNRTLGKDRDSGSVFSLITVAKALNHH